MADQRAYRFKIEDYTPETMPMKRLAEYLADLSALFGEDRGVHLIGIESGSTCPVMLVDWEAEPKVLDRIQRARNKEGPEDAIRAIESINTKLKKDNTSAFIQNPERKVIEFPGAKHRLIEWPSINQAAELYGVPILVGGRTDLVPVHLLDGEIEWNCLAQKAKSIEIAKHLFTATMRVSGRGRWRKVQSGEWSLERFIVDDFEVMRVTNIGDALKELRAIKAKWKSLPDPLGEVDAIRRGERS